ncbi:MAG TPA: hypothetical protein VJL90_16250 [Pseudorhodoplanes sp.]|nr:hypothetical protein [Pseudorhodoplanes sp.]
MSMEMSVFFKGKLPDTAALTLCMQQLGFPIAFVPPHYSLEGKAGFRPMLFREKRCGAEFHLDEGRDAIEEIAVPECLKDIDPRFDRCASFRFGGDWDEVLCAACAAAALAKLVNGAVYEPHDGVLWSVDQAIKEARKMIKSVANMKET